MTLYQTSEILYLIGMPGVGKTTIGRLVAKRMNRRFVDMDQEIERAEKLPVPTIIDGRGIEHFRILETQLLNKLDGLEDDRGLVVATGGGVSISARNRRLMNANGVVICLTLKPAELLDRVAQSKQVRPLVGTTNQAEALAKLLEQRREAYATADLALSISQLSPAEACQSVCQAFEELANSG